jgi:hypothetical protein
MNVSRAEIREDGDVGFGVLVVSNRTQTLTALFEIGGDIFRVQATPDGHRLVQSQHFVPEAACGLGDAPGRFDLSWAGPVPRADLDDCGNAIIDVFFGFSEQAAAQLGDIDAEATMLTESANSGLVNSEVEDVRLRLVGTTTAPYHEGIRWQFLDELESWFGDEASEAGADLLAWVDTPTGAADEAGGWAYVMGYTTMVGSPWPTAWRHEVGHNAGGSHCKPEGGSPFSYGYGFTDGGNIRTHMCGNQINYYSTPDVSYQNVTIGTDNAENMARVWRERGEAMGGRVAHTIPYPDCDGDGTDTETSTSTASSTGTDDETESGTSPGSGTGASEGADSNDTDGDSESTDTGATDGNGTSNGASGEESTDAGCGCASGRSDVASGWLLASLLALQRRRRRGRR